MLTHTVVNQAPRRAEINEFSTNIPLVEAVRHYDAGWAVGDLEQIGALVGKSYTLVRAGLTKNAQAALGATPIAVARPRPTRAARR